MENKVIPFSDYDTFQAWIRELTDNNLLDQLEVMLNQIPFEKYDSFESWIEGLKLDNKVNELANKLKFSNSGLNLVEKRNLYLNLEISDNHLKMVLLKVYNDYYKRSASYTKDFLEFFNNRYLHLLESKINVINNLIKKANRNPKRRQIAIVKYYSGSQINFRLSKIRKILTSRNYTDIFDFDIKDTLNAYPKWKDLDIVNDLIERCNQMDLVDSDIVNMDEIQIRDNNQLEAMYEQYSEKEKDQENQDIK